MLLIISGIPVDINKKDIKNMRLYIKPPNGDVTVSAPLYMSNEEIELFVHTKVSWIKEHIRKLNTQLRRSKREYVSGETLYVWGKQYYLHVEYGGRNSLKLSNDKAILTVRENSTTAQREKFIREWYRKQLKEEIERLLPKWEKITKLKCNSWQIKNMTTRWGSCKPKARKLCLNLQLAKKNPECLEYIILHELAHILEKHHNERFKSFIGKYMPKWKEIKSALNNQPLDYLE